MSSDHHYYEATCKHCGKRGFRISSTDDWNRSKHSWEGFEPLRDFLRYDELVTRKQIDVNEYAKCECGSTDIEVSQTIVKSR